MASHFSIDDYTLSLIKKITETNKYPFYLYNKDKIRNICRQFRKLPYSDLTVHFASMANDNIDFLKIINEESINVFVNSLGHLACVQSAGFSGEQIVFTASAMDDECMRKVHEHGAIINHDSLSQIQTWRSLFPGSSFGIRCNIGSLIEPRKTRGGYFLGKESRLGIGIEDVKGLYGNTDITGVHVYVGTDIYDIRYFKECYETLASVALNFPNLKYIDFGGGFGSDFETGNTFDFDAYGGMITEVLENLNNKFNRRIKCILEPGRIIGAEAGYFVCRVIDVKTSDDTQLAGVNASAAQFPRPLFYPDTAFHPVALVKSSDGPVTERIKTNIYGCSTYSRDFLANNVLLPPLKKDDLLVFGDAGAYCASSHTHFLGFPKAKEIFYGN